MLVKRSQTYAVKGTTYGLVFLLLIFEYKCQTLSTPPDDQKKQRNVAEPAGKSQFYLKFSLMVLFSLSLSIYFQLSFNRELNS